MSGPILLTTLKYLVLSGCVACWGYAAYNAARFEGRLRAKNPFDPYELASLNGPQAMVRRDLPKRALEARRKVYRGLAMFAVLAVCLLVILYFDASGPARSPFLFRFG